MVVTIKEETFYINSRKQDASILFAEVTDVMFKQRDKTIVIYITKGYKELVVDSETGEDLEILRTLEVSPYPLSQSSTKAFIEATGSDFNAGNSNLLNDEFDKIGNKIIMNDITENKADYFDYDVTHWEVA